LPVIVSRRKTLPHEIPLWVDPQREIYFITVNCRARGTNQLATTKVAPALFETICHRQEQGLWWPYVFLLMPDHVHALISFPPPVAPLDAPLGHLGEMSLPQSRVGTAGPAVPACKAGGTNLQQIVTSWKRWTARQLGIRWQRDFFEHRLRHEESRREKADYILQNPVRKMLAACPEDWPFVYFADGQRPQFTD